MHEPNWVPGHFPTIPLMQGQVIFADDLNGGALETFVSWGDIQAGQRFVIHWRGRSVDGVAADDSDTEFLVTNVNLIDGKVRVWIAFHLVDAVRGGEALYSYEVLHTPATPSLYEGESLRLICFIDRPSLIDAYLPVAQLQESHGLVIDLDLIGTVATASTPPYPAMAAGDRVTLTWQGYRSSDTSRPLNPVTSTRTLDSASLGSTLLWQLPKSALRQSERYHGTLSWSVQYAGTQLTSRSTAQPFSLVPPLPGGRLAPIQGPWAADSELDPGAYPEGLVLRCPAYPRLLVGDVIVVYWIGRAWTWAQSLQVDPSVIDSGKLEFHIKADSLAALGNGASQVLWQCARRGSALSSDWLSLDLRPELSLPAPMPDGATREPDTPLNQGYLRPLEIALAGKVTVRVPANAETGGYPLALHWQGIPQGGQAVIAPVDCQLPAVFEVAPAYAAANMGARGRTFEVFYRAMIDEQLHRDSLPYRLWIPEPDIGDLPTLYCPQAQANNRLSLVSVGSAGIGLQLSRWLLMAAGQRVWLRASGTSASGPLSVYLSKNNTQGQPVSSAEVEVGLVMWQMPLATLGVFLVNTALTFAVEVSFDQGATRIRYPDLTLQLVP